MFFTPDMAEAFGDWLELDRIQGALIEAQPELADELTLHTERPLLQVHCPDGGRLLVARAADESAGCWLVGVPGRSAPVLHDAGSTDEVVRIVLAALGRQDSSVQ